VKKRYKDYTLESRACDSWIDVKKGNTSIGTAINEQAGRQLIYISLGRNKIINDEDFEVIE